MVNPTGSKLVLFFQSSALNFSIQDKSPTHGNKLQSFLDLLEYMGLRNQLISQNRNTAAMETITKALTSLKEWEEAQLMMRYKATSNSTDDLGLYRCRMEFRNEICRPGLDLHRSIGFGLSTSNNMLLHLSSRRH